MKRSRCKFQPAARQRRRCWVSVPHCGTEIAQPLLARMVPRAQALEDTRLAPCAAICLRARSGRQPDRAALLALCDRPETVRRTTPPMYPDANSTGLCPERFFLGRAALPAGSAAGCCRGGPSARSELAALPRRAAAGTPAPEERARLRAAAGWPNSIKSELPWLFCGAPAGPEPGHRRWRELRAFAANGNVAVAAGPARFHPRGRRPLQGRLHC